MKKGFTFIEMIFVIVIMGILAKFGSEIFRKVYLNYNQSVVNSKLQTDSESAIQQIANRLQYRIKDSVIARNSTSGAFKALQSADSNATILEWIGYDIDGFLGDSNTSPTWSGFIDVNDVNTTTLNSPQTSRARISAVITALSNGNSNAESTAIFFEGATSDVQTDYGWDGVAIASDVNRSAHRVFNGVAVPVGRMPTQIANDLAGVDVYEQYKLAWTAYALVINDGNLTLFYDYQPWDGESYDDANIPSSLIMQNVDTFKFQGVGDMIKLQICIHDNNITAVDDNGGYALCKEKAIF